MSSGLPIAVIGGGPTGLAAAYRLSRSGETVRLFEINDRLGGSVHTERDGEWLWESGPNSLQLNERSVAELLQELGITNQVLNANPASKNRYLVKDGVLQPLPSSLGSFLGTSLFSAKAKLRILTELFFARRTRSADATLSDFIRDHFGQEIVDYALNPFVSGIYAGDPARLSARNSFPALWEAEQSKGSLIRGMMTRAKKRRAEGHPKNAIISFENGLQTIIDALVSGIAPGSIETNAKIETLLPGENWRVVWSRGGETHTEEAKAVIVATPALAMSGLHVGSLGERPLAALAAMEYPPVTSLFLGFKREQVAHPLNGFGVLCPSNEQRNILGVIFSSSLFPRRAPDGAVAITVMLGGIQKPQLAVGTPVAAWREAKKDLADLLGVHGEPLFARSTHWPRAIPQYQLGHERLMESITAAEQNYPGFFVAGHVRDGISLPNSLISGLKASDRARRHRV